MKEYIKNIIAESLKDEVDVDREWERLFSSIEKKTISKMKTRRLFLQYMKYAAAVLLGIGISLSTLYLTNQENLSTVGNYKLVTSKGEKSYLQLPDGTKVWLNSWRTTAIPIVTFIWMEKLILKSPRIKTYHLL